MGAHIFTLTRKHTTRMTQNQELANMLSQCIPSFWFGYLAQRCHSTLSPSSRIIMYSAWLHLPFSVVYHYRCAFNDNIDPIRDVWRRLDNTFIHVASFGITCGTVLHTCRFIEELQITQRLSGIFPLYIWGSGIFNMYAICQHWREDIRQGRNQIMTFMSIALYLFPFILYCDEKELKGSLISLFPSLLCFKTYIFGGYSHTIFHIGMGVFGYFLLESTLSP